jgi:predicted nucleic acid-binding protein
LDKSAHELARRHPDARRTFEITAVTGVLATCAIVELEILYSARNSVDHLRQCVWLETSDATLSCDSVHAGAGQCVACRQVQISGQTVIHARQ